MISNDEMNCVNITIYEDLLIEAIQALTLVPREEHVHVLFEGTATLLIGDNDRMFAACCYCYCCYCY